MAARATWKGYLKVSLVNIPIRVFPATDSAASVSFNQLHSECLTRIQQKKWCPKHDREVPNSEIVKGYEYEKGRYVVVTEEDIEKVRPASTRVIDLQQFAERDELDPIYFERPYYLAPDTQVAADAFAVIREGMPRSSGPVAVAPTMPTTVAASVSTLDSISTCWSSRPRPAPIDARTIISRIRAAPRASSRLATFEQAMSSTTATITARATSGCANCCRTAENPVEASAISSADAAACFARGAFAPVPASRCSLRKFASTVRAIGRTDSGVAPGASRPQSCSQFWVGDRRPSALNIMTGSQMSVSTPG